MDWDYTGPDPGIQLFTAAYRAWPMIVRPHQRVLEIGCNESPFLNLLKRAEPTLECVGLDWRERHEERDGLIEGWSYVQGYAWDASLFPPHSFDWVFMVGALEHFGIGFYGDPKDPYGDSKTMAAIADWLKPDGFCYFDVPCNPVYEQTHHYRVYTPHRTEIGRSVDGLMRDERLVELARGYTLAEPANQWVPQPLIVKRPYHYVAVLAQKRGE